MKHIEAAGTVTLDTSGSKPKVLLVHRPSYDDWTIPKGKIRSGEFVPVAAYRETLEETGTRVRLDIPVNTISYPVGGGHKTVHYWRAEPLQVKPRKPNKEVDNVVWLSIEKALGRLTYADERELLEQALGLPNTTAVGIVRHAKAVERRHWDGQDQTRPVNPQGRRQADELVPLLTAYGMEILASSTSTRCLQTLKPYEGTVLAEIKGWAALSEEQAAVDAKASGKVTREIARQAATEQRPAIICGHRPVLPVMFEALGIAPRPLQPGDLGVTHLDANGEPHAMEWFSAQR